MKRHTDSTGRWTIVWAIGMTLAFMGLAPASATPIVDGRFDPNEGYTLGRFVDFAVEDVTTIVTGGELWTYEDPNGDVTVAFIQPLTLVDNTYGVNSIGWGSSAPSGKNHNLEDLVGSDKAQFVFTDGLGNVVLDFTLDYIGETAKGSGVYFEPGVTGKDGTVDVGSVSDVKEWGSSLGHNFFDLGFVLATDSPATDANYVENASYPGWIFEVIYEVKISGSVFGEDGFGAVTVPLVHDSPNKIGKNKVYPDIDGEIPEPATLSLLGVCGGLILARRRRRS